MAAKLTKVCPVCGKTFTTYPSYDAKTCSHACAVIRQRTAVRQEKRCKEYGCTFQIRAGHTEQNFCTKVCLNQWRKKHGSNCPGSTPSTVELPVNAAVFITKSGPDYVYCADFGAGF